MSKVFMLTPAQIAEIEGLKNADSISVLINRVSDQLRAGEIELFPITKLEALEAKQCLDRVSEAETFELIKRICDGEGKSLYQWYYSDLEGEGSPFFGEEVRRDGPFILMVIQRCLSRSSRASTRLFLWNSSYQFG